MPTTPVTPPTGGVPAPELLHRVTSPTGAALVPEVLRRAALPDGRLADVHLRDGLVAEIRACAGPDAAGVDRAVGGGAAERAVDLGGALLLPAFVDGHAHLDKTFLGSPWQPHLPAADLRAQIAAERELRRRIPVPVEDRATALARRMAALGTGYVRSHVDIDPDAGLAGLHALLAVREACRDLIGIQLVAFPQSGVVTAPGVADLLDAALREGADLVGGLDPVGFDGDMAGQLDVVFGLAERHGAGIDIHLHDGGADGIAQLREIARRTAALDLGGRVAVSHAYALGQVGDGELGRTAEVLAQAGVAIMTNGPAGTTPPVRRLRELGVRVFAGSDNIRDAWWPYGTGDMLERATIIGLQCDLMTDTGLHDAADLATDAAAAALGLSGYGLAPGCRADLVAVDAASVPEAVAAHPARLLVLHGGRVTADHRGLVHLSDGGRAD
ncbi:amidohydrolase [Yinghuangia soli]|uniref:Amidohydrolase n=1 Tax=Yinghuangia soli TaxID=2908204 RepID=A0AA41U396_9ACTN|nr:amidohydrolase [Yinghuangia soli]MCF2529472.1 amidohydrolase [Yinghuangia soli]